MKRALISQTTSLETSSNEDIIILRFLYQLNRTMPQALKREQHTAKTLTIMSYFSIDYLTRRMNIFNVE